MSISAETVFSVLVGGLISGLVTWGVAERYFRKQDARGEQMFEALVRLVRGAAESLEKEAQTHVHAVRDKQGRITDVEVTLFQGYAPTLVVTKSEDTRTKSGQTDGEIS